MEGMPNEVAPIFTKAMNSEADDIGLAAELPGELSADSVRGSAGTEASTLGSWLVDFSIGRGLTFIGLACFL